MKTLILYETQKGYTKSCGEKLHSSLEDAILLDINKDQFDLNDFDIVVVGAPIYEGEIEETTRKFFSDNKWKLLDKKLGIFCAGMNTEEFNKAMQQSLPSDIFIHAEIVHCGGKINYETLSRKEKRILKRRLGIKESNHLDYSYKLDELVKWIKQF